MDNEVIKALKTRRSVRSYKPDQITDDELKTVLEAGTWAPTAMGYQDPWIVAVQNPALLKKISRMNMMNAAHAIGLGSCWINREREMFATEEGKALMKEFGLPDGLIGIGALALGYPAGPARDPKPRKENYYRIVK